MSTPDDDWRDQYLAIGGWVGDLEFLPPARFKQIATAVAAIKRHLENSTLQSPTDSAGVQRTPLGPTGLQECHILSHICHILSHICDNMSHIFVTFCYILSRFVTFWSPPESGESGFYTIILSKTGLIWIIY